MKKFIFLFAVLSIGSPIFAQQLNRAEGERKPQAQPVKVSPSKNTDNRDRAVNSKEKPAQIQQNTKVAPMQPTGKDQVVQGQSKEVKLKKDGSPDKRYKENQKKRKDGKPDMRFKQNKEKPKPAEKKPAAR